MHKAITGLTHLNKVINFIKYTQRIKMQSSAKEVMLIVTEPGPNGNNKGDSNGDSMMNTCPMYAKIRWLLVESRGGAIRSRILLLLHDKPTNIHRISKELNLDYKTVKHHLSVLEANGLVKRLGIRYGDVYFINDNAYRHWDELYRLIKESLNANASNGGEFKVS